MVYHDSYRYRQGCFAITIKEDDGTSTCVFGPFTTYQSASSVLSVPATRSLLACAFDGRADISTVRIEELQESRGGMLNQSLSEFHRHFLADGYFGRQPTDELTVRRAQLSGPEGVSALIGTPEEIALTAIARYEFQPGPPFSSAGKVLFVDKRTSRQLEIPSSNPEADSTRFARTFGEITDILREAGRDEGPAMPDRASPAGPSR